MAEDHNTKKFGEIALQKGFITREELEKSLEIRDEQGDRASSSVHIRDILLREGFITEEEADEIARTQAKKSDRNRIPGYKLIKKLGEGGTGAVYKARQKSKNRDVAIKVLFPSIQKDKQFLKRFFREARTVARLDHKNIIRGIDVGEHDGLYYFVMEFVDGQTLLEILEDEGLFSEDQVIDIGLQISRALIHANENGLVHRDIKPENIMIDREGVVKLCDLGLAKKTKDEAKSVTRTGASVGTPYYMSPEQAKGKEDIDIRTDIYSLGGSMYKILTGRVPFEGKTSAEIMTKHITEDLVPPRKRRQEISREMDMVIQKMMEKNPNDRYQKPEQLLGDLKRISAGREPTYVGRQPDARSPRSADEPPDSRSDQAPSGNILDSIQDEWLSTKSLGILVAALVALTAVVFLSNSRTQRGNDQKETENTSITTGEKSDNETRDSSSQDNSKNKSSNPDHNNDNQTENGSSNTESDGNRSDKTDEEARKWFQSLKSSVEQFEGNVNAVNDLSKELDDFIAKYNYESWGFRAKKLKKKFLKEQAREQYESSFKPDFVDARKKNQLARAYRRLDEYPNLFMNTKQWKKVQDKKKQLLETIHSRFEQKKNTIQKLVEKKKLEKARNVASSMNDLISKKITPELVTKQKKLLTTIEKKQENHLKKLISNSLSTYLSFQQTFEQSLPLDEKSIFDVKTAPIKKKIKNVSEKIPIDSFRRRLDGYQKDLRILKYYRKQLDAGITQAAKKGKTYKVDTEGRSKGRLAGREGNKLEIKFSDKISTSKSLLSLSLEERFKLAGADSKNHTTQKTYAFGLVAYLNRKNRLAKKWLKKAMKTGESRASFYLSLMRTAKESREVVILIDELRSVVKKIKNQEAEPKKKDLLLVRILLDKAGNYWDSEPWKNNQELIEKARTMVNPGSDFLEEK